MNRFSIKLAGEGYEIASGTLNVEQTKKCTEYINKNECEWDTVMQNLDSIITEGYQFSDISDLGSHHGPDQFQTITVCNLDGGDLIGEYQFSDETSIDCEVKIDIDGTVELAPDPEIGATLVSSLSQEKAMWFYAEFQSKDEFDINKLKVFLRTITLILTEVTIVSSIEYDGKNVPFDLMDARGTGFEAYAWVNQ